MNNPPKPIYAVIAVSVVATLVAGFLAVILSVALYAFGVKAIPDTVLAFVWPFTASAISAEIVRRCVRRY